MLTPIDQKMEGMINIYLLATDITKAQQKKLCYTFSRERCERDL